MLKGILIAAASTLAVSTPASAQYYHHGYGYHNGWGEARSLETRIHNVLRSLGGVRPDQRDVIRAQAFDLDRELHMAMRNGLNPGEAHNLDVRIGQLERHQQWASMNRDRHYWRRGD
jgi:hypothetical protein